MRQIRYLVLLISLMVVGCAKPQAIWQGKATTLEQSACMNCDGEPFYINGKWIEHA